MRTVFLSSWLTFLLLLAVPVPGASASHQPDDPAVFMAPEPLYGIKHDPWSGGTWVAGPGLFFHGDGGGVSHVGIREGLPINTVYDLEPTPTSLWVQTELGPAVMDKAEGSFRTVTSEDGKRFLHLGKAVLAEGDLAWVGTDSEGLFKVDAASLVATPVSNPINGSRFQHQIMDVVEDGPLLYISATGYGLVEWDRSTGDARLFDVAILEDSPLYGRVLVTPSKLWVGTSGDGVVVIDRVTGETSEYVGPFTVNARSVFNLDNLGAEYWFATEAGASRYDARTDSWQYWQGQAMPWGNANDVEVIDGEVYAATNNGHVIRFDRASDAWVDAHWWAGDKVLPYNTVFSCATDGGALLIGTGGGGALWHRESSSSWERIGYGADSTERPLDITLWDVDVSSGSAWFASHKGISVLDRQSGSWDHVRTDGRPVGHIVDNPVRDIEVDGEGLWAATASHKIVRGAERGEEQPGNLAYWRVGESVPTRYDSSDGLSGDSVLSVDVAAGRVWIGLGEEGVDVMDAETRAVQHVWPTDGSSVRVDSIVARPDAVWVGGTGGLHRIDPETLEVTKVTAFPDMVVSSLLWDDGRLWAGAIYGGVHRYDPLTDTLDSFTTGTLADVSGLCLVRDGGILYVGTQWGVDRLDIERGRWLPKVGAGDASSVRPTIQIAQPAADTAYAPGDTVRLRGTAQVPEGAWVEVGVAGAWIRATGTGSWNAGFPIDASFSGPLTLAARVFDGQRTLAQDAVRLTVEGAGEAAGFAHEQVLLAEVGSTIPFVVEFEPQDADVTGWVELRLPSSAGEAVTVPLEATAPGILSGASPVLEDVGEASYVVRLQWEDGQARLPGLYGGSTAYKVTIQEATGKPIGFLTRVRCDAGIAPGSSGEVTFGVQNTGARAGAMEVSFAGPASAWITEPVEQFDLPPSQTHFIRVPITVPEGIPYGPHDLVIGAGPVERTQGSVHVFTCGLVVDEAEGTQSGGDGGASGNGTGTSGRGAPHPGVLLALVALAVAWARRR